MKEMDLSGPKWRSTGWPIPTVGGAARRRIMIKIRKDVIKRGSVPNTGAAAAYEGAAHSHNLPKELNDFIRIPKSKDIIEVGKQRR